MKLDFSSTKVFFIAVLTLTCLMVSLFFWRINLAEHQIERNINERVSSAGKRVANSVIPIVYNIYNKATERNFTEDTASAILDAELSADFITGIKVYGNFGHLFMGKLKNTEGEFIPFDDDSVNQEAFKKLKSIRTPVKYGSMTIGNIEIYFSYDKQRSQLNTIIIQELLQILGFTLLIILLFYLVKKVSLEKTNTVKAFRTLENTQKQLIESEGLLKHANLTLEDKVNTRTLELQTMNKQLTVATAAADSASKAKSLFLANMSHEIRTPMNGVIGLTELVLRTDLNPEQKNYLQKLKYSSNNLLHILNDILDLSKIEAGKFTIEHAEFNFKQMLDSVEQIARPNAIKKHIDLVINTSEQPSSIVLGDSVRCSQILSNLISNAIKFTEKGAVTVDIQRTNQNDFMSFKISDTGIGITQEQQQKLFAPFSQADDSTSRKYGGTGLGLVICKHLIDLMQGNIQLHSEYKKGSCFSFNLYLPIVEKTINERNIETTIEEGDSSSAYISQKLLNKKALLVEDMEINRLVAQSILEQAGLIVEFAVNGLEAVNMTKINNYDLIVMDIQMPKMDGYEATKIIRTLPNYKQIPIIAMTANAMSDDKALSLAAGMNSHLTKPIQFEQVITELESFF
jgi:signal transduction histidine kinase